MKCHPAHHYIKKHQRSSLHLSKEVLQMTNEFEKHIKKLGLDPKAEKELIDMLNKAVDEDPCMACESKEGCENFKWHKKWLNTDKCNCCP
jgi:hypothetical protein